MQMGSRLKLITKNNQQRSKKGEEFSFGQISGATKQKQGKKTYKGLMPVIADNQLPAELTFRLKGQIAGVKSCCLLLGN